MWPSGILFRVEQCEENTSLQKKIGHAAKWFELCNIVELG